MPAVEAVKDDGVKFFSEVDLNSKGKVSGVYPGWYYDQLKDELKEQINFEQYQLDNNLIPKSEINLMSEELNQKKKRLRDIEASMPKLKGLEKDKFAKVRDELGEKISESMFSRTDMKKGFAYAHEEARRMSEPCINLTPDMLELADKCNVRITGKKVSRTHAEKIWKIVSKTLGEQTNTEHLRKD